MADIQIINGPNLNLLGLREPSLYGSATLADIEQLVQGIATQQGISVDCVQSNAEYVLIDKIHSLLGSDTKAIVINPGAFTHTSVALRDALLGVSLPFYEVHISNVHQREKFRSFSYLSDVAAGVVCGLGIKGYGVALRAAITHSQTALL